MKKIYINLITPIVIGVFVELIVTLLTSLIKKISILNAFKLTGKFILSILMFKISLWILLVIILCLFILLKIIYSIQTKTEEKPWYDSYKQDFYKGKLYRWDYYTLGNTFRIDNLHRICSECEGGLNLTNEHNGRYYCLDRYFCPTCDKVFECPSSHEDSIAQTYFENKIKRKQKELINNFSKK